MCIRDRTGIRLIKPEQALTPWRDVLGQLAGSATNLLVFFLLSGTLNAVSIWSIFATIHLLLGIFNLLPLKSLSLIHIFSPVLLKPSTVKSRVNLPPAYKADAPGSI